MTMWVVGVKWFGESTFTIHDVYTARSHARRVKKAAKKTVLDGDVVKMFKLVEVR